MSSCWKAGFKNPNANANENKRIKVKILKLIYEAKLGSYRSMFTSVGDRGRHFSGRDLYQTDNSSEISNTCTLGVHF